MTSKRAAEVDHRPQRPPSRSVTRWSWRAGRAGGPYFDRSTRRRALLELDR